MNAFLQALPVQWWLPIKHRAAALAPIPLFADEQLADSGDGVKLVHERDGIFTATGHVVIFGWAVPTRMSVVRLRSGALWVHNPVELTDDLKAQLDAVGQVEHVVSPNLMHHVFVDGFARAFPRAKCWASSTDMWAKRSDVAWEGRALDSVEEPEAWRGEIAQVPVLGLKDTLQETVFVHHRSRTLLLCDLAFNWTEELKERECMPWMFRAYLFVTRGNGVLLPTLPFRLMITDKELLKQSLDAVMALPWTRVSMAHGDVVERDARAAFGRGCYRFFTGTLPHDK